MSYFDDNEDRIIYGGGRARRRPTGNKLNRMEPTTKAVAANVRKELAAPPGSELARLRIAAHAAFDPLWTHGPLSRRAAYDWLAIKMGWHRDDCHMIYMNEAACLAVINICNSEPACRAAQALADPINDFEDLSK